jgi:hypothetical protein
MTMSSYHGNDGRGYFGDSGPDPLRPAAVFTAYCGAAYVTWGDSLPQLLSLLEDTAEPDHDIAIWCGFKLVAVRLAAGLTVCFLPEDARKAVQE